MPVRLREQYNSHLADFPLPFSFLLSLNVFKTINSAATDFFSYSVCLQFPKKIVAWFFSCVRREWRRCSHFVLMLTTTIQCDWLIFVLSMLRVSFILLSVVGLVCPPLKWTVINDHKKPCCCSRYVYFVFILPVWKRQVLIWGAARDWWVLGC